MDSDRHGSAVRFAIAPKLVEVIDDGARQLGARQPPGQRQVVEEAPDADAVPESRHAQFATSGCAVSKGWSVVPGSPQMKCSIARIGQTATRALLGQRSGGRSTIAE
jgi:hypothetical protein